MPSLRRLVRSARDVLDRRSTARLSDDDKVARIAEMYAYYRQSFEHVESISAEDLAARLVDEPNLVLVDVRKPEEQAVSMIASAINQGEFERRSAELAGRTVVTYCTIGKRSGLYAAQLLNQGWHALNFGGSVLSWTHAGQEFEHEGGRVRRVHVYGARWSLAASGYETVW